MRHVKAVSFILMVIWLGAVLVMPAPAQQKAAADQYLTKEDVIQLISATDFMKKKISDLFSWTVGYDISKVNRVRLTPMINYVSVVPKRIPPDGRTILELYASVDDPGGLTNISGVRADLSQIGRLPNTILVDSGLYGDQKKEDGIYTLQTSIPVKVGLGAKDISVAVANKKGWLALAKTSLDVAKNPVIIETQVQPEKAQSGSGALVTLAVKIDNPGRLEDVRGVVADLRALGMQEGAVLLNDGTNGDKLAKDDLWTMQLTLPPTVRPGTYNIPISVNNQVGGHATGAAWLTVN